MSVLVVMLVSVIMLLVSELSLVSKWLSVLVVMLVSVVLIVSEFLLLVFRCVVL